MKKLIYVLLYLVITNLANAQWEADVRLTGINSGSYTSLNRCIASSGNDVHAVYQAPFGSPDVYYMHSSNGGANWGTATRLTNYNLGCNPSISVSGLYVHIVWYDFRDGNYEIYYKRSTDAGTSWGADTRLTINSAVSSFPSISVSGLYVHIVWYDKRDGNSEIYYKRSTDGGVTWGTDTRLTNNSAFSEYPSISVSNSIVNVVWQEDRDGNYEIYYKRSTDAGTSWGADTRLTNSNSNSYYPSVSQAGSIVHIVWQDERDGNYEIYYKCSTNSGTSWEADKRLTNDNSASNYPSIWASGNIIHIVWSDHRGGTGYDCEIYYKCSLDGGTIWGADTRLTNAVYSSEWSSVTVSGSAVHVIWADTRDGSGYAVYYKRNPIGNVGITIISYNLPSAYSLSQNYPNPFNPTTNIKYQVKDLRVVTLKIYDILGKEVENLVNEKQSPGIYEVSFDGSKLTSGIYYYTLTVCDPEASSGQVFKDTKKMLLIK